MADKYTRTMIPCECGARLYFSGNQHYLYFYCSACTRTQEIPDIWKRRALVRLARQGKPITWAEYQRESARFEARWQEG
ncbi:MAG: hypothetical protein KGH75_00650 [Rhodospirillales bacterium]|nr:hypothetical protein [Rhodospirillales bacterium]